MHQKTSPFENQKNKLIDQNKTNINQKIYKSYIQQ
jgi:hypothetical protein